MKFNNITNFNLNNKIISPLKQHPTPDPLPPLTLSLPYIPPITH